MSKRKNRILAEREAAYRLSRNPDFIAGAVDRRDGDDVSVPPRDFTPEQVCEWTPRPDAARTSASYRGYQPRRGRSRYSDHLARLQHPRAAARCGRSDRNAFHAEGNPVTDDLIRTAATQPNIARAMADLLAFETHAQQVLSNMVEQVRDTCAECFEPKERCRCDR